MEKLICLLNIEHMLLLKLDVNPLQCKHRDIPQRKPIVSFGKKKKTHTNLMLEI